MGGTDGWSTGGPRWWTNRPRHPILLQAAGLIIGPPFGRGGPTNNRLGNSGWFATGLPMRLLPNLFTTAGVLALPLSDRTAEQLVRALLTHDAASRLDQFREAVDHDPLFALWAVCRAALAGHREIRTTCDLAAWLSDKAVAQLCLPADE